MTSIKARISSRAGHVLAATAGLLVNAPAAFAQQQILAVNFTTSIPAAPLSDWLTAGIALLLAATAVVMLRRQNARGARLFGWMLAVIAGTAFFSATGQRLVSDAQALMVLPTLNLISSPATLDVAPYSPLSPLTVTVTNGSGKFATINSITLNPSSTPYTVSGESSCSRTPILAPSATCIIMLFFSGSA
jgi:hypothetical protein